MGRPRLPTPEKYCEACGARLERRENARGTPNESVPEFNRRRFCNHKCWGTTLVVEDPTLGTCRQRAIKLRGAKCEVCAGDGTTSRLEIHHKDENPRNNDPANLMTLCQRCHAAHHWNVKRLDHGPPFNPERGKKKPKTHCPQGHSYAETGFLNSNGHQECRECRRATGREYMRRKRAMAA